MSNNARYMYKVTAIIIDNEFGDLKNAIEKLPDCFDSIIISEQSCNNRINNLAKLPNKNITIVPYNNKATLQEIYENARSFVNSQWVCFIHSNEYFDNRFYPTDDILGNTELKAIAIYKINAVNRDLYFSNINHKQAIYIEGAIYNTLKCSIDEIISTNYMWLNTYGKHIDKTLIVSINDHIDFEECNYNRINSIYSVANRYDSYERISDSELNEIVETRIDKLNDYLLNTDCEGSISLYSGDSGRILYLAQIYLKTKEQKYLVKIYELIDSLNLGEDSITTSFCSGLAGYGWLLNYLVKHDIIEVSDEYFEEIDSILAEQLEIEVSDNQFDQMHNAISIGRYFICRNNKRILTYLLSELSKNKITTDNEVKWESVNLVKGLVKYDFGLAHGMAGILYFISKCYELNIQKELCTELVNGVFDFYRNNEQNYNKCNSFFPTAVSCDDYSHINRNHNVRFAWCYGDAGVLYSLYLCSKKMNINELMNYSLEKLKKTINRIDTIDTAVNDAGFCHGSSSLMHIYNRLYLTTNDDDFLEAAKYWAKVTIIHGSCNTNKSGYLFFTDLQNWSESNCLLEGVAGVALSLLSMQYNKNIDWDECMMLS